MTQWVKASLKSNAISRDIFSLLCLTAPTGITGKINANFCTLMTVYISILAVLLTVPGTHCYFLITCRVTLCIKIITFYVSMFN